MIINSTRILLKGGTQKLARHVFHGDENDAIKVLKGSKLDLKDMEDDARKSELKYSVRHFTISPQGPTDKDSLKKILNILFRTYNAKQHNWIAIQHSKKRASGQQNDLHWHILVSEASPITGKVLDSKFSRIKNEKISRLSELELGHKITKGKHNKSVIKQLKKEGFTQEALALEQSQIDKGKRPKSAYTRGSHQKLKKHNKNASEIKNKINITWQNWNGENPFSLRHLGYAIKPGQKKNVWLVYEKDLMIGALHRLLGMRINDLQRDLLARRKLTPKPEPKEKASKPEVSHSAPTLGPNLLSYFIVSIANGMALSIMKAFHQLFSETKPSPAPIKETKPVSSPQAEIRVSRPTKPDAKHKAQQYIRQVWYGMKKDRQKASDELLKAGGKASEYKAKIDYVASTSEVSRLQSLINSTAYNFDERLNRIVEDAKRYEEADKEALEQYTLKPENHTLRPM